MNEVYFNDSSYNDSESIDFIELGLKLWNQRKKIFRWCIIGGIFGLVIAFSIPREYETVVKLAPELFDSKTNGELGMIASMTGFLSSGSGSDAVYPQLYPDIVSSIPFLTGLFNVEVETKEDGKKVTVEQYLDEDTRSPWWSIILKIPGAVIGFFTSSDEEVAPDHKLDSFRLTRDEDKLVQTLAERITASVDQKTTVVTLSVTMQDPLVSAELADTVVTRLQEYITDYRTNKSRKDLEYAEKLNFEAQQEYYNAQQKLADYVDRNQGLATQTARITRDRLANETSLAFNLYNQTAQQVQQAKAKVQETTPVYAVVVPPSVPIKPVAPRKALILVGFIFLSFVSCSIWILFLQPAWDKIKNNKLSAGDPVSADTDNKK